MIKSRRIHGKDLRDNMYEVVYGGDKNSGKKKGTESNGINGAWGSEPNLGLNQDAHRNFVVVD